MSEIQESYKELPPKAQHLEFDAVKFVLDGVEKGIVIGHYVLIKNGKDTYSLPQLRIQVGGSALLDGVKIKTRFNIRYQ